MTPKQVAEKYAHKVWDDKDPSVIDQVVDQNVVIHSLLGDFHGPEALKNVVKVWIQGFPELKVTNGEIICENDLVTILWKATGVHKGEFKGKQPTGKTVSYSGATIYRVKNDKIVEYWAYLDMQHLLSQLK